MKMAKIKMKMKRVEVTWTRLTRNQVMRYQNMNIQSTRTSLRIRSSWCRQPMKLGLENFSTIRQELTQRNDHQRRKVRQDKKWLNLRGFQFNRPQRRESNLPKLAMPFHDIPFASSSLSVASGDGSSSGSGGNGKEVHKNHCLKESKLMSTLGSRTFSRRKKVIWIPTCSCE